MRRYLDREVERALKRFARRQYDRGPNGLEPRTALCASMYVTESYKLPDSLRILEQGTERGVTITERGHAAVLSGEGDVPLSEYLRCLAYYVICEELLKIPK